MPESLMLQASGMSCIFYVVHGIPDKDRALFASQMIPKGTRILSESILVSLPNEHNMSSAQSSKDYITAQVDALRETDRQVFHSFSPLHPTGDKVEDNAGIMKLNAIRITQGWALFKNASLINHSCDNNAVSNFNSNLNRITVHAIREIQSFEEITLRYKEEFFGTRNARR